MPCWIFLEEARVYMAVSTTRSPRVSAERDGQYKIRENHHFRDGADATNQ